MRIVLSAVIAAVVVTLLFLIVPITATFIIAYIFSLIAIGGIAVSLWVFGKCNNKSPQGFAYIYTAVGYAVSSTIVSIILCIIACLVSMYIAIPIVIHIAVLAFFAIRLIILSSGNEHMVKVDEKAAKKHKEFEKLKKTYWK